MRRRAVLVIALFLPLPTALAAQTPATRVPPDGVMLTFVRFADIFGSRLVDAFDSIPAARYDYRPTAAQQTIGYIAQHLEDANYALCERLGDLKHPRTATDSLADTIKARWPKDTLIARLEASLRFCDEAMERVTQLNSAALASTLWPESSSDFFVKEADAQVSFSRNASGAVTGLVLHQYGRDRPARKVR